MAIDVNLYVAPPPAVPGPLSITFPGGAVLAAQLPRPTHSASELAKDLLSRANAALAPLVPVFKIIDAVLSVIEAVKAALKDPENRDTIKLLKDAMLKSENKKFLIDGFPRALDQRRPRRHAGIGDRGRRHVVEFVGQGQTLRGRRDGHVGKGAVIFRRAVQPHQRRVANRFRDVVVNV